MSLSSVLTRERAKQKIEELIGGPPPGALRLWLEADEAEDLLKEKGGVINATKSESLQIKNIFFRGSRMLYRNPAAVAARGSRLSNPRGAPLRLSFERLWAVLGAPIKQRMQSYDFEALEQREKQIKEQQQHFLGCLRKTIGERFKPSTCVHAFVRECMHL